MMEWIHIFEKCIWFGCAAIGFAILFNVPQRTLVRIWLLAAVGGLTRVLLIKYGAGIIISSLAGSSFIGVLCIQAAHEKHAPPLVFAIPSVIPMIPGVFAYRTMLGFLKLSGSLPDAEYTKILNETVNNGLRTLFILLALAVGVSIPMLITRKSSSKDIHLIPGKSKLRK